MAGTRFLLGVLAAGAVGAGAFGQPEPAPAPRADGPGQPPGGLTPPGTAAPYLGGPASTQGPLATLTAPPGQTIVAQPTGVGPAAPPGTVGPLWCGGTPAGASCCGPVGANGPVAYEVYMRTGVNLVVGGGPEFSGALKNGVTVGGGGRSLFFNTAGDAAWVIDLGLSYTYTRGAGTDRVIGVGTTPSPNAQTGVVDTPEQINPFSIRAFHRTSFNYAVGRDYWLNGPGNVGGESGWNTRFGWDVGGRWGTSHVDLVPVNNPAQYFRRSANFNGAFLGLTWNTEVPLGGWVGFLGGRVEYGYDWGNVVPPQQGDLQDIRILFNVGVRF